MASSHIREDDLQHRGAFRRSRQSFLIHMSHAEHCYMKLPARDNTRSFLPECPGYPIPM